MNRWIGFSSQRIRYAWLEKTANMCLAGMSVQEIDAEILSMLSDLSYGGASKHGSSRARAKTILMRIWVSPRDELVRLRDEGIKMLATASPAERKVIHWGMIMAAYPYWASVAGVVGRLIRLQSTVAARQVRRRLIEQYGDRALIARATQSVLRSFVDWKVLEDTENKGVYTALPPLSVQRTALIAWLAEAFLHAHQSTSATLKTVLDSTSLFPFRLSPISAAHLVAVSGRLDVLRHGLDQDLIMLRTPI